MKATRFVSRFFVSFILASLVLFLSLETSAQTKGKSKGKKHAPKPGSTPVATTTPQVKQFSESDKENKNDGPKPRAAELVEVGTADPYQALSYETPFLENCPKKSSSAEKRICVGIGQGGDKATPKEIEILQKTVSRIFSGKRFVMVRLEGSTPLNLQDDATVKGCDFLVETKYISPFTEGNSGGVTDKVVSMTSSELLPKAVTDVKVVTDDTNKSGSQKQADAKPIGDLAGTGGRILGAASKLFGGGGSMKFEITFNLYRPTDVISFISLKRSAKIGKDASEDAIASTFYNLLRESVGTMQQIFRSPDQAKQILDAADSNGNKKN